MYAQMKRSGEMKHVEQKVLHHWTIVGKWYGGPAAPNGSVPGTQERRVWENTVFEVDYGRGVVRQMNVKPFLHYIHNGCMCESRLAGWQHGNQKVIDEYLKRMGCDKC